MLQIIYASTATREMSAADLSDLLDHARRKNDRLGITGLLLYKNRAFLQAFEGEEQAVRRLYETIKADERHYGVATLMEERTQQRDFPNWQMGFEDLEGTAQEDLPEGFARILRPGFEAAEMNATPGRARDALLSFRDATF